MIIDQCKDKVPAELASHELLLSVRYHVEVRLDHLTTQNTDAQLHHDNTHNKHILSRKGGGGGGVEGEGEREEAGAARLIVTKMGRNWTVKVKLVHGRGGGGGGGGEKVGMGWDSLLQGGIQS